jgi:hypothetical protein
VRLRLTCTTSGQVLAHAHTGKRARRESGRGREKGRGKRKERKSKRKRERKCGKKEGWGKERAIERGGGGEGGWGGGMVGKGDRQTETE